MLSEHGEALREIASDVTTQIAMEERLNSRGGRWRNPAWRNCGGSFAEW